MSSQVRVTLATEQKWKAFHPRTEMIVTKRVGRVIFPHLDYTVTGLDSTSMYTMKIHLERVNDIKYRYEKDEWVEATRGVPRQPIQHTEHEDGARNGKHWMGGTVSFASLKITNDPQNENKKLVLVQSLHKYQPVLTITRLGDAIGEEFRHDFTQFMVVTAYQCKEVIQLKMSLNKFAAGSRYNGGKRRASKHSDEGISRLQTSLSTSSNSSSNVAPTMWNQFPIGPFPQNPVPMNSNFYYNPALYYPYYQYYQNQQNVMNMMTANPETNNHNYFGNF